VLGSLADGCGEALPPPGTLVVAFDSDPDSLDPRFQTDANGARLADLLYAGLTRADAAGRRIPELARTWEMADSRSFVFRLRPDFRFPDGTAVTAADVKATYDAVRDPALASPKRAALATLSAIEAPDPTTVVMRLTEPFAPLLDATGLGILPAARAREAGDVTTGAGPFQLVSAERGDRLVLAPNPGYPDGAPRLRAVVVRIVPDELVRVLELRRGGVHLVEDAPEPETVAWLATVPSLLVRRIPGTSFVYLALNLRDPRLAAGREVGVVEQHDHLALGRHRVGGQSEARQPRHDPRRARRLLDLAGYRALRPDTPRFRLVYKTSAQPVRRRLAEAVQAELGAVGIAVDVRVYEWGTLYADVRSGNFELASLAWVGVTDPDLYYLAFHSTMMPPAGYNRGAYVSRVTDRLTKAGRQTFEPARRRAIYARVQRRLAHDLPVVPLWWEDRVVVQPRRLHGFEPSPSGDLRGLASAWLD